MVLGFLSEADYKLVAKAIRQRVTTIKLQREKQSRLLEQEPESLHKSAEQAGLKSAAVTSTCSAETVAIQVCFNVFPWNKGRKVTHGASCCLNLL